MDIQDYRDEIHVNEKGQKKITKILLDYLISLIDNKL